ncbi:hypothetical protein IT408_01020 [Candidatus Uhrbacteria bacterium]|nr:hypothetical protein [Candidatus Uhrbacteria bacterium]
MPDSFDNLQEVSSQISALGALESNTSVNLESQADAFDSAWTGMASNPEKSLKQISDQVVKFNTEAQNNENDQAITTARNFSSDVQELTRIQQALTAAKGRRDQKAINQLQAEYASSSYRAKNTYDSWRRIEVEQYKIQKEELKKKQQQAANEIQRSINKLDKEIGSEGNEKFIQLRSALQAVQSHLKSAGSISSISLPGGAKFDVKKGKFSTFFENWKNQNKINEKDLRKQKTIKKESSEERVKENNDEKKKHQSQQRESAKQRAKIATIQKKAGGAIATSEPKIEKKEDETLHKARRDALLEYGKKTGLIQITDEQTPKEHDKLAEKFEKELQKQQSDLVTKDPRSSWSAQDILRYTADVNEEESAKKLERFIQVGRKLDSSAIALLTEKKNQFSDKTPARFGTGTEQQTSLQKQFDSAITRSDKLWQDFPEKGVVPPTPSKQPIISEKKPETKPEAKPEAKEQTPNLGKSATIIPLKNEGFPQETNTTNRTSTIKTDTPYSTQIETSYSGKVERRLKQNFEEFKELQSRTFLLSAELRSESDPNKKIHLAKELNVLIQQGIKHKKATLQDSKLQIELLLKQPQSDERDKMIQSIIHNTRIIASAITFIAKNHKKDLKALNFPIPPAINFASELNESETDALIKNAQISSTIYTNNSLIQETDNDEVKTTKRREQTIKALHNTFQGLSISRKAAARLLAVNSDLSKSDQGIELSPEAKEQAASLSKYAKMMSLGDEDFPNETNTTDGVSTEKTGTLDSEKINNIADEDIDIPPPAALSEPKLDNTPFELPTREQAAAEFKPIGQTPLSQARKPGLLGALPPKTRLGSGINTALALQSQKQSEQLGRERNLQELLSDTEITDSSIFQHQALAPLLELYDHVYTEGQNALASSGITSEEDNDIQAGGGLILSESDQAARARQLQRAQQQSRRNFIGGDSSSFSPSSTKTSSIEGGLTTDNIRGKTNEGSLGGTFTDENINEVEGENAPVNEGDRARNLMRQKMAETRQKMIKEARKKIEARVKNQIKNISKKVVQKGISSGTRIAVETAEAASGPETAAISWLMLIVQMNLQLILKYVLKGFGKAASMAKDAAIKPEEDKGTGAIEDTLNNVVDEFNDFADNVQTLIEDVVTIWLDCWIIFNIVFFWIIYPIIVFLIFATLIVTAVFTLIKMF